MTNAAAPTQVLLGLDVDRPRWEYRDTPDAHHEAQRVVEYLDALLPRWADRGARWTLFMCGSFVRTLDYFGLLREFSALVNSFDEETCEIGCHTLAHTPIARVPGRTDLIPLDVSALSADLAANEEILHELRPTLRPAPLYGFRAPYGAARLAEETIELLRELRLYSSSLLRTESSPIGAPLIENGSLRQPFRHANGLWEIPSHGYHDTYFADISGTVSRGRVGASDALQHYGETVSNGVALAEQLSTRIYVGLTLHPFAMTIYDADRRLLDFLISVTPDPSKVAFTSYRSAVRLLEQEPRPVAW